MSRTYIAIDLKSFYASVECVERRLDPLSTNLVVADSSRTEKTICLAVSPSLKAYGISGRARLFEVIQRIKEINTERLNNAIKRDLISEDENGQYHFTSSSADDNALKNDPSLELTYITATPQMRLYEEYSSEIISIYMKYISPEDIHVYSIDEVFIDATKYLNAHNMTARKFATTMIREVLYTTGITATAGIGTNMYLAKIAMDIVAKHEPGDKDGVRVAELDEHKYRELLWCHRPLTDFWRVGRGYRSKLETLGIYTMGDIARASMNPEMEEMLYKIFGINAELLIDHAWGWEPSTIEYIRNYQPLNNSVSSGQVLKEPYDYEKCRLIVKEMAEQLVHDLVRKGFATRQIVLTIGYDRTSIKTADSGKAMKKNTYLVAKTEKVYTGKVVYDPYGRAVPDHAHGTGNLDKYTNSLRKITEVIIKLYERIADPDLMIRRVILTACNILPESLVPEEEPEQLDLFTDYTQIEKKRQKEKEQDEKERRIITATLSLHDKFGKNSVLKGMNFIEGGTTIERNGQIGGHKA